MHSVQGTGFSTGILCLFITDMEAITIKKMGSIKISIELPVGCEVLGFGRMGPRNWFKS